MCAGISEALSQSQHRFIVESSFLVLHGIFCSASQTFDLNLLIQGDEYKLQWGFVKTTTDRKPYRLVKFPQHSVSDQRKL